MLRKFSVFSAFKLGAVVLILFLPAIVLAQEFSDDFEDYTAGESIMNQSDWSTWDAAPAADTTVSDTQAASGNNSLLLTNVSDIVKQFVDVNTGVWVVKANVFVSSAQVGVTYFLLLNTYADGGPYNWSVQLSMNPVAGTITDDISGGGSMPLVIDDWAEIKVLIDFDHDVHTIYYNGEILSDGASFQTDGQLALQAVDLYSDGATNYNETYIDDFSLLKVCIPVDVERSVDSGDTITMGGVEVPFYKEGDKLDVSLELTNVRENGGDCPDLGDVTITETLPEGWTAENITGGGVLAGGVITWQIPANDVAEDTFSYSASGPVKALSAGLQGLVSEAGNEYSLPIRGGTVVSSMGVINDDGYFLSWLVLGPLSQGGGANPGEPAIYSDYLATIDDITQENVLPKIGDLMEIDFGLAASTGVLGPTTNGLNPDALDGAAEWYFYEDPDGLIDSNEIYGGNYDNMMIYHVSYLINKTADTLFLEGFASSDDTAVYMLDNSVYGITYWNGYIDAPFPFILPPGEHRLMVKLFEGGGGNGIHFRLHDPETGEFITGADDRIEVGIAPTMTEVPAAPTAAVTRDLPGSLSISEAAQVTLTVTDGPVTIYEKVPGNMDVSNYGAGVLTNGIIKWTGVSDSVTYTVTPQSAGGTFSGAAEQADGIWLPIGGDDTSVFPEEIEGWFTYDIADSGLLTQTSTDIINNGDGSYDMTIDASGHDIWDTADDFRYTWKSFPVDGIAVIQGRLDVFTRTTNDWAKAGFMFRKNLTQGSPFVIGDISVASGVAGGSPGRNMQWRDDQEAAAAWDGNQPPHQLPDWIRVVYNQGLVTVYFAQDSGDVPEESDWVEHGSHDLNIDGVDTIYGGVAVSSHDDNALVTAEFSNVEIVEPCIPAKVTRSFTWDTIINAEGTMAPVIPADGSTPLPVNLAVTDVRANGGTCPDLGDITIIETLPAGWTAENISDGGDFDDGFSTITWSIPAAQAQEKTLTYDAVGEFVNINSANFDGTITEAGNNFTFKVRGQGKVVSDSTLGANAEILTWLILGPFGHASVSIAPFDQTVMEADNLTDGADITEESIMTDPAFFQVAGDEITPDYNGEAATTGLHPAINPDVNPNYANGTAQWIPYFDQDGLQVDLTNKGLYGTNNNAMCYGLCYLKVDEEMDVVFAAGSDDAIQVLLDGNEILIDTTNHGWNGFNQFSPVQTLSPGAHVLMTKTFNGTGGWNFGVQLLQADGTTPVTEGITVSITPPATGPTGISVFSGDANGDDAVNLADAITLLSYQFAGGDPPACMKAGDVNNDGAINLADAITLLSYQFSGGNLTAPDGGQLNSGTIGCTLYPENTVSDLGCIAQCAK